MDEQKGPVSEFAIASLVLGILSFVTLVGLEKPIFAIVLGILALRRIGKAPQTRGKRLAIAGVALSAIAVILILWLVAISLPKIMKMQQLPQPAQQPSQAK